MEIISVVWVLGIYFVLVIYGFEVEASHNIYRRNLQSLQIEQPYRTAYHFQPPKNWMNDPNGPMYYKGVYHLFYQYNPFGPLWGNIVWGHSISYDLINWVHLDHAIYPSHPFDINGCWSGSATFLPGDKPAILYTGADKNNGQVQNLAVPKNLSDPLLREWVKSSHNPLMTPIDGIDPNFFRDPTTAWQGPDRKWRVVIGSQINGHGTALLYRSIDFVIWTRSQNPLHSSNKTAMWECPDFYPVSINGKNGVDTSMQKWRATKHVLKASFNQSDYYIMGNYEPKTDQYRVDTDFRDSGLQLRYDYGKFYASKTFFDKAKQRRILWGWINESDSESDDIKKGWSGLQADVEVSFDFPNLEEAEFMDLNLVDPQLLCSQNTASNKGVIGPFGLLLLASKDLAEQTAIFFRIFKSHGKYAVLMCSDQSRSSLLANIDKTTYGAFVDLDPRREKISLRSLIDHSIVESFGGEGRTCITARVYPSLAIGKEAHLYVFNNGSESVELSRLSGRSMKKAQIVPIQKRRKSPIN